jgi:hypothetical protein
MPNIINMNILSAVEFEQQIIYKTTFTHCSCFFIRIMHSDNKWQQHVVSIKIKCFKKSYKILKLNESQKCMFTLQINVYSNSA